MSSSAILHLTKRATMAEDLLVKVKAQLEAVKKQAMLNMMKGEQDRLAKENEVLREEVEDYKKQLMLAEINNGIRQIPVPTKRSIDQIQPSSGDKKTTTATNNENAAAEKKGDAKETNKEKKAKVEKPKKGAAPAPPTEADLNIDVSKLDLRVGLIVSAKKHPDADKQYVEEVNVGDPEGRVRTVVSGLVQHMPVEALQNRQAIFLCNLKPAKIRGVLSEAMLVCACTPEKVELLNPPAGSEPGDRVTCAKFPGKPEPVMNPKKKIWETVKPDMRTNNKCVATFKGEVLVVEGKGEVKSPSLGDAQLS